MPDRENEIIKRILAGETRAYAELVDSHKDKAMTLATRILKNREDAEEALQDAFVRAFKALDRFEGKSSFATWFYRIVFNVCTTALGKRSENLHLSIDADNSAPNLEVPSEEWNPQITLEASELQQVVHEEIEHLPPAYGAVLTLFVVQELGYNEIVQVTGLPSGTVKSRLFRARKMLRDAVLKRFQQTLDIGPLHGEIAARQESVE